VMAMYERERISFPMSIGIPHRGNWTAAG